MCELVTFAELKDRLNLSKLLLSDYPELASIKDSVQESIKSYLGCELCYGTYVERVSIDFSTGNVIPLRALPIESITSIQSVSGSYNSNLDVTNIEDTDNYWMDFGWLNSKIELPTMKLDVTYVGGFETMPESLHRAALIQTLFEYQTKFNLGATTISEKGIEGVTTIERPPLELLTEVKSVLKEYIHPAKDILLGQRQIISFAEIP